MAGAWAGWIALILAVFDPNLIANSRLITTDLGLTLFMTLTMWRLWVWLKRPSPKWRSWLNLILVGVLAGCTMAAKFTGLLIWPMIVGVLLLDWLKIEDRRLKIGRFEYCVQLWPAQGTLQSLIFNLFLLILAAYAALWAIYRFDFGPIPGSVFRFLFPRPFTPTVVGHVPGD
jgi:dolichyl-phosphate-mannose--protein O-mannosyl transferase